MSDFYYTAGHSQCPGVFFGSIHTELPREERVLDFIRQIRNPYCFRHGKIVVKIGFSEAAKETTMEEQFESYLRTL